MPRKVRHYKRREHTISEEAVRAFSAGDYKRLFFALDWRPWWPTPFDAADECPDLASGSAWAQAWPRAVEIRKQLIEACRERGLPLPLER